MYYKSIFLITLVVSQILLFFLSLSLSLSLSMIFERVYTYQRDNARILKKKRLFAGSFDRFRRNRTHLEWKLLIKRNVPSWAVSVWQS